MQKGLIVAFIVLSILLSASSVSALGEWKQYGKDAELSQYQPYSVLQSTAVISYSVPLKPVDELLVSLPTQNVYYTKIDNYASLQPLIGEWNSERSIIIFANVSNQRVMRLYRVVNKTFQLKSSYTFEINEYIHSASIYDLDNDASDEIIVLQSNVVTIFDIEANGSIQPAKSFANPIDYILAGLSNLVCSDFLGGTCFYMSDKINGSKGKDIMLFNYSYTNPNDNILKDLTVSDFSSLDATAKVRASVKDVMDDSRKEIIFTLAYPYGQISNLGDNIQLVIINETSALAGNVAVTRNITEFGTEKDSDWNFYANQIYFYETITKADDMDADGEAEIIIALNSWFKEGFNNISDTALLTMPYPSVYETAEHIANRSGSRWLWLDDYDNNNLDYFYMKKWYNKLSTGSTCVFPLDIALNDFETSDDAECSKNLIAVTNQHQQVVTASGTSCANNYNNFNAQVDEFFCYWGSHYFTRDNAHLSSGLKSIILDNRNIFAGISDGQYYYLDEMPNHGITSRSDAIFLGNCSFESANDLVYRCPRYTFGDVDKDGLAEVVVQNSTSLVLIYQTNYTANAEPSISGFCYNTGEPVCYNNSITYIVNYSDAENDEIAMRVDCKGFGNYTSWSSFSTNPSVTCNYNQLGNFITNICITDLSHYPTNADCETHEVNVAYSNCYEAGQGGDCKGVAGAIEYDIFGLPIHRQNNTINYHSQYGFDWSRCSGDSFWFGACPFGIWIMGIATSIGDWIFANFFMFIIILLIVIFIIFIKRSMQ